MKNKHFTDKQIEYYSKDSRVKYIDEYRLVLTLEFRKKLYEECNGNYTVSTLKKIFEKNNFRTIGIYSSWFSHTIGEFKVRKPCGAKNNVLYQYDGVTSIDKSYDEYLLSTGKFIKCRNGIKFSTEFIQEIYSVYPDITIEEYINSLGFDTNRIGYQRIYHLKKMFDGETPLNNKIDDTSIKILKLNPYVKRVNSKQFSLRDNFFNEAIYFRHLNISDVLRIFEIDPLLVPIGSKNRIKYLLSHWKYQACIDLTSNYELLVKIEKNKYNELLKIVNVAFDTTNNYLKYCSKSEKKEIIELINNLDYSSKYSYTKKYIREKIGVSKTSFYSIINDTNYGKHESDALIKEKYETEAIRKVIEYKGLKKGSRLIYSLLPKLTGIKLGRAKILKICRKSNLTSTIRTKNGNRRAANKMLEENVKPNLVKRKFKLCKPGDITLTDVSYLKCLNDTFYLSAIKDSCSGMVELICSKNNNLDLANDTINLLDNNDSNSPKIFHSDQGVLYLNPTFQLKLKEMGYVQSMSKRGNCWDNSSMESFFGHFKDECDFSTCNTLEDLIKLLKEYEYYYNYERVQWSRNKMTPYEFKNHINNMTDEEYKIYYDKELIKYNDMVAKAAEKAIKRAKDIGIDSD